MESSNYSSDYSSDTSDFVDMYLSDSTSSVAAEASSYSTETDHTDIDSGDDVAPIAPYQFEPMARTELLDNSSEESSEEDEGNDERLLNLTW